MKVVVWPGGGLSSYGGIRGLRSRTPSLTGYWAATSTAVFAKTRHTGVRQNQDTVDTKEQTAAGGDAEKVALTAMFVCRLVLLFSAGQFKFVFSGSTYVEACNSHPIVFFSIGSGIVLNVETARLSILKIDF